MLNKIFCILLLFITSSCCGQMSEPFCIGSVSLSSGEIGNFNYVFVDSGKCIFLNNGIAPFLKKDNNLIFSPLCPELTVSSGEPSICPLIGYPNPTRNHVTLKSSCYNNNYWLKGTLKIINELGQVMYQHDVFVSDLNIGFRLEMSRFIAGKYIINVVFGNANYNIKIIRQNER